MARRIVHPKVAGTKTVETPEVTPGEVPTVPYGTAKLPQAEYEDCPGAELVDCSNEDCPSGDPDYPGCDCDSGSSTIDVSEYKNTYSTTVGEGGKGVDPIGRAREIARDFLPEGVELLVKIARKPFRGSASSLLAFKTIYDVAMAAKESSPQAVENNIKVLVVDRAALAEEAARRKLGQ